MSPIVGPYTVFQSCLDQLPETAAYVRSVLAPLSCTVTTPIPSAICAFFDAGKPETVAFRADMDALPVTERTGLPYASIYPGRMHACGHDGHMSMALALAEHVSARLSELPRNVLFLFQPAEETFGGAGPLCATGILEQHHVQRVFGLHLWPGLPAGAVYTRPGPLMARANEVTITVTGKSVHLSRAAEGRMPWLRGWTTIAAPWSWWSPAAARVLGFGRMVSGTVRNAVSGETILEGSLRTYQEDTYRACREGLIRLGVQVAEERGCEVDVHLSDGYPAVWNHEALYVQLCRELGPKAPALLDTPVLAAEDFSFLSAAGTWCLFLPWRRGNCRASRSGVLF